MTDDKKFLLTKILKIMKIQIIIGIMLAVLFLINSHANIEKADNISSQNMVIEAIIKFYPNTSVEEAEVLMKSEAAPYGYEMEDLETGKKLELERDQKGNMINTENF
jgi:hypothetical protein